MPRFAILRHDHPFLHWDFLLEDPRTHTCRTWRLDATPANDLCEITAALLPDHRLHYLTYEGPVSNGRGTVTQWDAGEFSWIKNQTDHIQIQLAGRRFIGKCELCLKPSHWIAKFTRRAD